MNTAQKPSARRSAAPLVFNFKIREASRRERPPARRGGAGTLRLTTDGYFGVPPLGPARVVAPEDGRTETGPRDHASAGACASAPAGSPPLRFGLRSRWAPRLATWGWLLVLGGWACVWPGCSAVSSTTRRAGGVAVGAAAGGVAGYALSEGDARATGLGALAGGVLTHLGLGRDPAVLQEGFDQGYVRGQSDAVKRHYFLRQALERRPLSPDDGGRTVTYLLPGPATTPEGIRLAPHVVATTVRE